MVGGTVIGIARGPESTLVHCQDNSNTDRCSIRVIERRRDNNEAVTIAPGDSIWWQGRDAMWTPKGVMWRDHADDCGKTWDIHLPRIGYSHS